MKIKQRKEELFSFRLPTEMKNNLDKIAIDNKSTTSKVIRYAVTKMLDNA